MSQHTIARMNSERESLTRAIGTVGLAAGIINMMIGGGIFRRARIGRRLARRGGAGGLRDLRDRDGA